MNVTRLLAFSLPLLAGSLCCPAQAADHASGATSLPAAQSGGPNQAIRVDMDAIRDTRAKGDLDALVALEGVLEKKWRADKVNHAVVLRTVCDELSSTYGLSKTALKLEEQFALLGLQDLPLDSNTEYGLLVHLHTVARADMTAEDRTWQKTPEEKAVMWLQGWQRLRDSLDPTFDPHDVPMMNVSPPGVGMAGMDPAAVHDPAERAQYEAAIRANSEKARRYNIQHELRMLDRLFTRTMELFLPAAFAISPLSGAQVEDLLKKNLTDAKERERLLVLIHSARSDKDPANPTPHP